MSAQKRKANSELPRPNKQAVKESSTVRRKNLGNFIEVFGDAMPKACSNCRRLDLECKVHVKSGICGKCHLSGGQKSCDVRVTQEEWLRLVSERARLLEEVKKALEAQRAAEQARQKAADQELAAREELRKIETEAEDVIAVEEAQIQALERFEAEQATKDAPPSLALSPYTWSVSGGVPDDFWESSDCAPWVLT